MLDIIILAAGMGTRMRSRQPKVLHFLGNKPILSHVMATAKALAPKETYVVYGHAGEEVKTAFPDAAVTWVHQAETLGTGHAVMQCADRLSENDRVLVLLGDVPLITQQTLTDFIQKTPEKAIGIITTQLKDPSGLGRIVRGSQEKIRAIVEHKDATEAELKIREINTGILLFPVKQLKALLKLLKQDNAQGEYYLTDVIHHAVCADIPVVAYQVDDPIEVQGINDRAQLATIERAYQLRLATALMKQGVTMRDPHRFDLRGTAFIAEDVDIDVNVVLEGEVTIGRGTSIGPNCVLKNVTLGEGVHVYANSIIEDAIMGNDVTIGPYARVRPGTVVQDHVKIGNFVEIKKSVVGVGSKIPHLSYIGDATIGRHVNIGAGTITCNYDGANKHQTIIGDHVFVGSDTQLVAPITLGEGCTIAAGTTVTKNTAAGTLTLSRTQQKSIEGWQRPTKSE